MNSESGKARADGSVFFAPFTVLKILGGGVFGRIDFNRSKLQLLADVGRVLCREMKAPFGQPSDHSLAMRYLAPLPVSLSEAAALLHQLRRVRTYASRCIIGEMSDGFLRSPPLAKEIENFASNRSCETVSRLAKL